MVRARVRAPHLLLAQHVVEDVVGLVSVAERLEVEVVAGAGRGSALPPALLLRVQRARAQLERVS